MADILSDNEHEAITPTTSVLSVPRPTTSTLPTEDAAAKLEDHRCAICQKIMINACRIDCGHTFCRHCLNTDREMRCDSGKATCFICDAAVTEIGQNTERDKEIDELYTVLSTDERLSRERAKSERKEEEETFAKTPKGMKARCNKQSSESIASGDASFNRTEADEQTSWSCTCSHNDHYDVEGNVESGDTPSYYCGQYSYWSAEQDQLEEDECNCACDHEGFDNGSNSHSECSACANDEDNEISEFPNSPFPQPIVIHHTVQHVYHTFEARTQGESSSLHALQPPQPRAEWRRRPEHNIQISRQREQLYRPIAHQNYRFSSHYRSPGPTYSSAGFYDQYQDPVPSQAPFVFPSCHHSPYDYADRYPTSFNTYIAAMRSHHGQCQYQCASNESEDDDVGDNDEAQCFACENSCEFHQTMCMDDHRMLYETASERHQNQEQHLGSAAGETDCANLNTQHIEDAHGRNSYTHLDEFEDDQGTEYLTFNVSIPISNLGTRANRISRQRSSYNPHLSQNDYFASENEE